MSPAAPVRQGLRNQLGRTVSSPLLEGLSRPRGFWAQLSPSASSQPRTRQKGRRPHVLAGGAGGTRQPAE